MISKYIPVLEEAETKDLLNEMEYIMDVWSIRGYVDDLPGVLELERELIKREENNG